MISCQQDDLEIAGNDPKGQSNETVPVKISLSVDGIQFGTGYEPMKSQKDASDEVKLKISNLYRIIIMKKVEGKIRIDSIATGVVDKSLQTWSSVSFKDGDNFDDLHLELTPGEYYLSVFTGYNRMEWNDHIKRGGVVAEEGVNDGTHAYACTYLVGQSGFINSGMKYLGDEIFSGTTSFIVRKTEDLHSQPDPALENIKIHLKRRVTKYRILLHDPVDQPYYEAFASNYSNPFIVGDVVAVEGKFVDGLDIWGNPWYNPDAPLLHLNYSTEIKENMISFSDGKYFFSTHGTRVHAPFFFSKEGDDVKVKISNIRAMFSSNSRYYKYFGDPIDATFIHNHIDGIVFRPGTFTEDRTSESAEITHMELEMDGTKPRSSQDVFTSSYAEYNFLQ